MEERIMYGFGMPGYGGMGSVLTTFIPFAFVIVVFVGLIVKGKKGGGVIILEEFNFNENEDEFLVIKGRVPGFGSLLSLLNKTSMSNKDSITSFTCNKRVLKYETSKIKYTIPLVKIVCVSSTVIQKFNMVALVFGVVAFIGGIIFTMIGSGGSGYGIYFIIVGIVCIIVFFMKKRKTIYIGIYIGENKPMVSITMEKGKVDIDAEKFEAAANTLNRFILANAVAK
jgi:hypothetical protein